jgi:hypothetical protein
LFFSGCALQVVYPPVQLPPFRVESTYQNAVRNASIAEKDEIAHDLIAINPENKHLIWNPVRTKILVITWKSRESYETYLKPYTNTSPVEANVVWVSTAPQVQRFCQDYMRNNSSATKQDIELRLKQYLGLNPAWEYDVFVEMWISPSDIFRPCVDPEVNDSACKLTFQNPPLWSKGLNIIQISIKTFISQIFEAHLESLGQDLDILMTGGTP